MIEKYVSNFELSKEMKELGFLQKSIWYWYLRGNCKVPEVVLGEASVMLSNAWQRVCSAYLVGELGEILPSDTPSEKGEENAVCWMSCSEDGDTYWDEKYQELDEKGKDMNFEYITADTEANARSKMAIYLKRKGLI